MIEIERLRLAWITTSHTHQLVVVDAQNAVVLTHHATHGWREAGSQQIDAHTGAPIEASVWMDDPAHPASLQVARMGGLQQLMAQALLTLEPSVAARYEGGTVEIEDDTLLRVLARSSTQRVQATTARPRPRLSQRIDVWF